MNLSGIAVAEILNYFESEPKDIIVIFDDINIPFGTLRLRKSGSAGGHNGIKSIINSLDTIEFPRLRIGFRTDQIDSILNKNPDVLPDLVLSKIPSVLKKDVTSTVERSIDALYSCITEGIDRAMNRYNSVED
jgi:PTH1 family peptidyl-tRNA hydrolase